MRSKQLYIKRAIEASFLKLLDSMPFEKITVKNIVDDCGLTRNTFYNYFEDTYDIVDGLLRAQMCDLWYETERDTVQSGETERTLSQAMRRVAAFALEHPRAVKHLFRSTKREELICYFDKAIEVTVAHVVDVTIGDRCVSAEDRRLIVDTYRFVAAGFFKQWVAQGMQSPLQDTLDKVDALFEGYLRMAITRAVDGKPEQTE